jgi:hypothetical protein
MHKLTLDPSTQFGWCLFLDDSERPEEEQRTAGERLSFGTWDMTKDQNGNKCTRRGQYCWNLWASFNALRRKHGIEEDDVEIILEGESYGSQKSEAGRRLAAAWFNALEMMCERKGLLYPRTCPPDMWRKAFIGCTKAPKEVGAGMADAARFAARREWAKQAVLAECRRRNLKPQNDNEADAIGMMFWLVRGGTEHARADKKAKTAAKRAQKKLDLQVAA